MCDQLSTFLKPQESGNHTGVRWARVYDDAGVGLLFEAVETPMEFSALPWTTYEIDGADTQADLPPIRKTVVRPALMRRGVGGDDSWGARTHPEYLLPRTDLIFRFAVTACRMQ